MWFNDDSRYNRRVGVPLVLSSASATDPYRMKYDTTDPENDFNTEPLGLGFYAPHNHLQYLESDYPDPSTIPNWPKQNLLIDYFGKTRAPSRRLWHTSEIHTFFEYRKTEMFEFEGDDDVWVFLNGILAVDVGGVHSAVKQSIDLSRDAAAKRFNMTVGGVYTFDMFQAERQFSESNFGLTTTLAAPCNAANEANSKLQFNSSSDLTLENVKRSRGVTLNADGSFILTNYGTPHSSSYLWLKEPVNVGTGFVIEFDFTITNLTEGFAFVLHRRPEELTNLPISSGPNFGFKGFSNSMAILFDLCADRIQSNGTNETSTCKNQVVSVRMADSPEERLSSNERTRRVYDSVLLSLKTGAKHSVKLDYFFTPPALEVTIDGSLYLRQMPFNANEVFQSNGAYAGFTSTTGPFDSSVVTVTDFKVFAVDVEASTTTTVDFPQNANKTNITFSRRMVFADGIESDGFTIQTRDGCKSAVEFGGRLSNTRGIFIERVSEETGLYTNGSLTPNVVEAKIEDDNSGRYKYFIQTELLGLYSFYMYYGNPDESCELNVTNTSVDTGGQLVTHLTVLPSSVSSHSCFYAEVVDAIEMIPLNESTTVAPTLYVVPKRTRDDTAATVAAVGSGICAFFALIGAFFVLVYRRKWQRDKEFILDGQLYKLDANTNYDPNSKLGATGRQLLASREAISRLRAQRGQDEVDLTALENEQAELLTQVMKLKKKLGTVSSDELFSETIPVLPKSSRRKVEF